MSDRVLVTGGAGLIGSFVCESLLRKGCRVMVIDNLSSGAIEHVPEGAELVVADLTGQMAQYQLSVEIERFRPQYVMDLAAEPYIPDSYSCFGWSMGVLESNMKIAANLASLIIPYVDGV